MDDPALETTERRMRVTARDARRRKEADRFASARHDAIHDAAAPRARRSANCAARLSLTRASRSLANRVSHVFHADESLTRVILAATRITVARSPRRRSPV